MAEFCKKCFVEQMLTSAEQKEYKNGKLIVVTTADDDIDCCESCGAIGPVVDRVQYK